MKAQVTRHPATFPRFRYVKEPLSIRRLPLADGPGLAVFRGWDRHPEHTASDVRVGLPFKKPAMVRMWASHSWSQVGSASRCKQLFDIRAVGNVVDEEFCRCP